MYSAHCRFDFETSQGMGCCCGKCLHILTISTGNEVKQDIQTSQIWRTFCDFLYVFKYLFTAVSQLLFLLSLARSQNEMPVLVALCLAKPVMSSITERSLWTRRTYILPYLIPIVLMFIMYSLQASVMYIHDQQYLRLRALTRLTTQKGYKEEVITGGLSWYLVQG